MKTEERMLELRKYNLRLSRKDMAEKTGIKEYKLRDVELGNLNISIDVVDKIVHTFNINTNWLLFGEGEIFLNKNNEEHREANKKIINGDNAMINVNTGGKNKIENNSNINHYSTKNNNNNRINELIDIYQHLPPKEQEIAYYEMKLKALKTEA